MDNNSTHRIIINGKTIKSVTQEEARASMARIFKLGDKQLDLIFQDKPLVFKKGLSAEQAKKFTTALEKCGLVHKIDPPLPVVEEAGEEDFPQPDEDLINANTEAAEQEEATVEDDEQESPAVEAASPEPVASAEEESNEPDFEATMIMDNAPGRMPETPTPATATRDKESEEPEMDFEATMIMDNAPGRKPEKPAQDPAVEEKGSEESEMDFEATMIMDNAPGRVKEAAAVSKPEPQESDTAAEEAQPEVETDTREDQTDEKPALSKNKIIIGVAAVVVIIVIAGIAVMMN